MWTVTAAPEGAICCACLGGGWVWHYATTELDRVGGGAGAGAGVDFRGLGGEVIVTTGVADEPEEEEDGEKVVVGGDGSHVVGRESATQFTLLLYARLASSRSFVRGLPEDRVLLGRCSSSVLRCRTQ